MPAPGLDSAVSTREWPPSVPSLSAQPSVPPAWPPSGVASLWLLALSGMLVTCWNLHVLILSA